jgi:hypothetical protein
MTFELPKLFAAKKRDKKDDDKDIILPRGPFKEPVVIKPGALEPETDGDGAIVGFGDPEKVGH